MPYGDHQMSRTEDLVVLKNLVVIAVNVILLNVGKNFKTPITLLLTTPVLGSLAPLENVDAKVDEQLSS